MVSRHRVALGVVLMGNAVAFAGVDPPTRVATAALVLLLFLDMQRIPEVPRLHRAAMWIVAALFVVQVVPLPESLRRVLQPGFAEVMADGWAPLSLAPWATVSAAASGVVLLGVTLTASRMAATRSGLPLLLGLLAVTGVLIAVLGLAGEAGTPDKILLVRDSPPGSHPYGPFVNPNHFAQAMELTMPACLVLLAAGARRLRARGGRREVAAVMVLSSTVAVAVTAAALLRSGSRGGALFLVMALAATAILWVRPFRFRGRLWPAVVAGVLLVALVAGLSWNRLPELEEDFRALIAVEGVDGNTRWDLWTGTVDSWKRSPVVGSGLGSYRFVIGMDKPATGESTLEQAHNDWLEWASTTGFVGVAASALLVAGIALLLAPGTVRRQRYEKRYALAGAALVLTATGLHEMIGFGLQTPANRLLLAAWVGLIWGLAAPSGRLQRSLGAENNESEGGPE
ncbi:MAG: O-antigen ligase family protein [Thermoanaerobaculales bacterium]|jgi:O-antigen ligase|nr:O-antigen ligase family protein [Thermoanaerobaculales bacterium]